MFDFLEKLSKKPENKRRLYAVLASLGVTLMIFAIWLSVILPTSIRENTIANAESSSDSKVMGPIRAFGNDMAQAFLNLKDKLGSLKEMVKTTPAVYTAEPQNEAQKETQTLKETTPESGQAEAQISE